MRSDKNIKGFEIADGIKTQTYNISQYADDSVIILKGSYEILPVLQALQKFGELAGLKLNMEKTKILLIGTLKGIMKSIYNFECVSNIKKLGIYVGHDKKFCAEWNWSDKITKMRLLLQRWQARSLTLHGKVTVMKSLILPIIAFSVLNCETPIWASKTII